MKYKTAIITGGAGGIGSAIAKALVLKGINVMLAGRDRAKLTTAAHHLKHHGRIAVCPTDVTKYVSVERCLRNTEARYGPVDVVINAAAVSGAIGPTASADPRLWHEAITVNLVGTFHVVRAALPGMIRRRRGKIINFSGGGDGPMACFSSYSASKGAVVRFTETLAAEVRPYHIDVNAIAPGAVNTDFLWRALAAGVHRVGRTRYAELQKQKERGGESPETAAALCAFLASSASDGLSGKFISAVWDNWRQWKKKDIQKLMKSNAATLRRVKP